MQIFLPLILFSEIVASQKRHLTCHICSGSEESACLIDPKSVQTLPCDTETHSVSYLAIFTDNFQETPPIQFYCVTIEFKDDWNHTNVVRSCMSAYKPACNMLTKTGLEMDLNLKHCAVCIKDYCNLIGRQFSSSPVIILIVVILRLIT